MLKKPYTTVALWLEGDVLERKNAGLKYSYAECVKRPVVFFNVNYIAETREDDLIYTEISSGEGVFVIPKHPDEVYCELNKLI